ncbi:MAG: hypothetical protein COS89_03570, partial [Deltaproteobacteria bacterium CG07_land_8_20_14_0_80_38_7]
MEKYIVKLANKKFNELYKKYDGFINVILDDWRGFRFIYDTKDLAECNNNCKKCFLYKLLQNEQGKIFTADLYLANKEDKKLFGSRKYLNCKSFNEYQNCYVSFLLKKCQTKKEIYDELNLIMNLEIIYSKNNFLIKQKELFIKQVIQKTLVLASVEKKKF